MDDEFTEFKSADYSDLLHFNESLPNLLNKHNTEDLNKSFPSFNEPESGLRRLAQKKKTFVFPYDLDLTTTNSIENIPEKNKPNA